MSYGDRLPKEELIGLCVDIAAELSDITETWVIDSSERSRHAVHLRCGDMEAIEIESFWSTSPREMRVAVCGFYPNELSRFIAYDKKPRITMRATTPARNAAKQIRSRILPPYRELLRDARLAKKAKDDRDRQVEEYAAIIQKAGQGIVRCSKESSHYHDLWRDAVIEETLSGISIRGKISSYKLGRVDLKIDDLRIDEAEQLIALLHSFHLDRLQEPERLREVVQQFVESLHYRIAWHYITSSDQVKQAIADHPFTKIENLDFASSVVDALRARRIDIEFPFKCKPPHRQTKGCGLAHRTQEEVKNCPGSWLVPYRESEVYSWLHVDAPAAVAP